MQGVQLSQNIKLLCKEKNIPINAVLKACSLSNSFIYDIEKRNMSPSIDKVLRIADYFNVSLDYLLGRDDTREVSYLGILTNILFLIRKNGLTENEFTKKVGLNKSAVSDWKAGKTKSYNKHLPKIAEVLGVSVDELLDTSNLNSLISSKEQDTELKSDEVCLLTEYSKLSQRSKTILMGKLYELVDKGIEKDKDLNPYITEEMEIQRRLNKRFEEYRARQASDNVSNS